MRFDRKLVLPEGYELAFKKATAIFRHARVYDGNARKLSSLKPLPVGFLDEFNGDLDFLGPDMPRSRVIAIAEGRLDPISMLAFDESTSASPQIIPPLFSSKVAEDVRSREENQPDIKKVNAEEDVWLETDEDLFGMMSFPDLCAVSSSSVVVNDAAVSSSDLPRDHGFSAHLAFMSSKMLESHHSSETQSPNGSCKGIVTLSPGKKRVRPLPCNNPFKRSRKQEDLSVASNRVLSLFSDEIVDHAISRTGRSSEKLDRIFEAQVENHCEQGQNMGKADSAGVSSSIKGGETKKEFSLRNCDAPSNPQSPPSDWNLSVVTQANNISPVSDIVEDLQNSMHWHAGKPTLSQVQQCCNNGCIVGFNNEVCEVATTLANSMPRRARLHTPMQSETGVLTGHSSNHNGVMNENCSLSISHSMMHPCVTDYLESNNVKSSGDTAKTAILFHKKPREHRNKKRLRSSRQSIIEGVSLPSTPGLLKFFQKAPTYG